MKYELRRNLHQNYLVAEADGKETAENYQLHMLEQNRISGLLRCERKYIDECLEYQYEITGMCSLREYVEVHPVTLGWLHSLLGCLLRTADQIERYLLDIGNLILAPEFIYYEEEQGFLFCYFPEEVRDQKIVFHELTAYLIQYVNHEDQNCVTVLYQLYKETMEANYSLREILNRMIITEKEPVIQKETAVPEEMGTDGDGQEEWVSETARAKKGSWQKILLTGIISAIAGVVVFWLTGHGWPGLEEPQVIGIILLVAAVIIMLLYQDQSDKKSAGEVDPSLAAPQEPDPVSVLGTGQPDSPILAEYHDTGPLPERSAADAAAGPRLVSHNSGYDDLLIKGNCYIIGRKKATVDGWIPANTVSRTHCKIVRRKNQYKIVDMDSRNGTFVGSEQINSNEGHLLRDGDRIRIADLNYLWVYNPRMK